MAKLPVLVRVVEDVIYFRKARIRNGQIEDVDYSGFYLPVSYNNQLVEQTSPKGYKFYVCDVKDFSTANLNEIEFAERYYSLGWALNDLFNQYTVYFYDDTTRKYFNIKSYEDYVAELEESVPDFDYTCSVTPFKHQIVGAKYIINKKRAILFWETGTGKTLSALLAFDYLFRKGKVRNAIIIVPNSLLLNWFYNHLQKYYPQFNYGLPSLDNVSVLSTRDYSIPERIALLKSLSNVPNIVILTNYDTFSRIPEKLKDIEFKYDYAIFDECHFMKNNSNRTKRIDRMVNFEYCAMLTGTPIDGKYIDYYNQFEIAGYKNPFYVESRRLFESTYTYSMWGVSRKKYTKVYAILRYISKNSVELKKEQCIDLPEKIYSPITIELYDEHMEEYKKFVNSLVLNVEEIQSQIDELAQKLLSQSNELTEQEKEEIIAQLKALTGRKGKDYVASILPKILYARMIVSGVFYSGKNAKIDWLKDVLNENEKYVIYSSFTHTINRIAQELKEHNEDLLIERIYGDTPPEKRFQIVDEFNKNGNVNIIIANPKVGGVGIDLVAAHTCIFYENDLSYIVRKQAEDRLHRIGQKNVVEYVDLIAKDTIDEYIYTLITNKREVSEELSKINSTMMLKKIMFGGNNNG